MYKVEVHLGLCWPNPWYAFRNKMCQRYCWKYDCFLTKESRYKVKLCSLVAAAFQKCWVVNGTCCDALVSLMVLGARLAEHLPVNCHSYTSVSTSGQFRELCRSAGSWNYSHYWSKVWNAKWKTNIQYFNYIFCIVGWSTAGCVRLWLKYYESNSCWWK